MRRDERERRRAILQKATQAARRGDHPEARRLFALVEISYHTPQCDLHVLFS